MKFGKKLGLFGVVAIGALIAAAPAAAQEPSRDYHLEQQSLGDALRSVGKISGKEIIFASDLVEGKGSARLEGSFTAKAALDRLLAGSGLIAVERNGSIHIRGRSGAADAALSDAEAVEIVITGSLIPGAASASPTITISQEQIRDAGHASLAEAVRSLPQASGAGQNPGIGLNVPESVGSYLGGASSVNLRGLGSDATLTLFNGRRLAFNGFAQAIDISSIPLAAVDRVEIVTDGTSALYGSDAVAGVVNVILKRDFDGLDTSARWGASTDGGNGQQQYNAVAGRRWSSGGIIATYDFERDTPILSRHRSYAATRSPGLTLYPGLKRHSVTASLHQTLLPGVELQLDGLFNQRFTERFYALRGASDYHINGSYQTYDSRSFTVSPSLSIALPGSWSASVYGVYSEDKSDLQSLEYSEGTPSPLRAFCYCNRTIGLEAIFRGKLLTLPAGAVKTAFGGGYRKNYLRNTNRVAPTSQDFAATQQDIYAFTEIVIPIVSPASEVAFLRQLTLSGAARYDNYRDIDQVVTPKVGIIASPSPDFDLKGSWGRSFKAPTLYQLYSARGASVYNIGVFGGSGYPAGFVGLYAGGGNPNLKPERATTWTATLSVHPRSVPGLSLDLTYFSADYKDRIVTPVTYITQALSNPIYADLVSLYPSASEVATALVGALFFNNSSGAFDPAKVGAIIYSRYANATHQRIKGVDLDLNYRIETASLGSITLSGNASYIESSQRLSALQPELDLAGTLFNPPHFRGRAGASWHHDQITVSPFVNYIGGVSDIRATTSYPVGSMTTIDITTRVEAGDSTPFLRGFSFTLTAQNLLNARPALIQTSQGYQAPYDSTNYSPWGRYVSLTISKSW